MVFVDPSLNYVLKQVLTVKLSLSLDLDLLLLKFIIEKRFSQRYVLP